MFVQFVTCDIIFISNYNYNIVYDELSTLLLYEGGAQFNDPPECNVKMCNAVFPHDKY